MRRRAGAVLTLMALPVSGCMPAGQPASPHSSRLSNAARSPAAHGGAGLGTLSGRILLVGGPAPGVVRAISGTVRLRGADVVERVVGHRGHFAAALAPGTYVVTGTSPRYGSGLHECRAAHTVVVTASEARHVDVFCQAR